MRPPGARPRGEQRREHDQRIGEDVRDDDVRRCRVDGVGQREAWPRPPFARGVRAARVDRLRIDVGADHVARAEARGADREDARAAAVVEHALAAAQRLRAATAGTAAWSDASRCRTRGPGRARG